MKRLYLDVPIRVRSVPGSSIYPLSIGGLIGYGRPQDSMFYDHFTYENNFYEVILSNYITQTSTDLDVWNSVGAIAGKLEATTFSYNLTRNYTLTLNNFIYLGSGVHFPDNGKFDLHNDLVGEGMTGAFSELTVSFSSDGLSYFFDNADQASPAYNKIFFEFNDSVMNGLNNFHPRSYEQLTCGIHDGSTCGSPDRNQPELTYEGFDIFSTWFFWFNENRIPIFYDWYFDSFWGDWHRINW